MADQSRRQWLRDPIHAIETAAELQEWLDVLETVDPDVLRDFVKQQRAVSGGFEPVPLHRIRLIKIRRIIDMLNSNAARKGV